MLLASGLWKRRHEVTVYELYGLALSADLMLSAVTGTSISLERKVPPPSSQRCVTSFAYRRTIYAGWYGLILALNVIAWVHIYITATSWGIVWWNWYLCAFSNIRHVCTERMYMRPGIGWSMSNTVDGSVGFKKMGFLIPSKNVSSHTRPFYLHTTLHNKPVEATVVHAQAMDPQLWSSLQLTLTMLAPLDLLPYVYSSPVVGFGGSSLR